MNKATIFNSNGLLPAIFGESPDIFNSKVIGFDRMFDNLNRMSKDFANAASGFPFHNVIQQDDHNYVIEMALAGYSKDDVEITSEDGFLTVKSSKKDVVEEGDESSKVMYKGISHRNFTRRFALNDRMKVNNAVLKDGLLRIEIEEEIPEAAKPKTIEVKSK